MQKYQFFTIFWSVAFTARKGMQKDLSTLYSIPFPFWSECDAQRQENAFRMWAIFVNSSLPTNVMVVLFSFYARNETIIMYKK